MMPLGPTIDVVNLFPEERAALLDLLASLAAEEWEAPTACPGWSVHNVALHLLWGDVSVLSRRRDGYVGPPSAAPAIAADAADLVAVINGLNDNWLRGTRRMSPRLLRDILGLTGGQLQEFFRTLDPNALGDPVEWAGPAPAPVWLDVAREYTERWVHQQHIRDAVGQPGLTERRFYAPVLDAFARALPYALRDVAAPAGARVRLVIAGEAGGVWTAVRAQPGWTLEADVETAADATVTIDQHLAWRVFIKGVSPTETAQGVQVTGEQVFAEPVLSMVSILA